MSQVQQRSTPPPLRDSHFAEAHDKAEFYKLFAEGSDAPPEAHEEPPRTPEPPPHLLEPRIAYLRTDTNVLHLDSARLNAARPVGVQPASIQPAGIQPASVWCHHEPPHHPEMEPRRSRPRNPKRPRESRESTVHNHYRAGHFIAALFGLMGWLMVGAGAAASAISILQPEVPVRLGSPDLLGPAAGAFFVGLLTVALGLASRALFDGVNATREILAIQKDHLGLE